MSTKQRNDEVKERNEKSVMTKKTRRMWEVGEERGRGSTGEGREGERANEGGTRLVRVRLCSCHGARAYIAYVTVTTFRHPSFLYSAIHVGLALPAQFSFSMPCRGHLELRNPIHFRSRSLPPYRPANQNSSGVQHLLKDLIQVPILEFVDQYPQSAAFHDGLAGNHVPLPQPMIGDSILIYKNLT